jgi:hypothetical protein
LCNNNFKETDPNPQWQGYNRFLNEAVMKSAWLKGNLGLLKGTPADWYFGTEFFALRFFFLWKQKGKKKYPDMAKNLWCTIFIY